MTRRCSILGPCVAWAAVAVGSASAASALTIAAPPLALFEGGSGDLVFTVSNPAGDKRVRQISGAVTLTFDAKNSKDQTDRPIFGTARNDFLTDRSDGDTVLDPADTRHLTYPITTDNDPAELDKDFGLWNIHFVLTYRFQGESDLRTATADTVISVTDVGGTPPAIPEPTTALLLPLALAGLAWRQRRR